MNQPDPITISKRRKLAAWMVHLFTASGAVFGLCTLDAIHHRRFIPAFWFMCVTIIIDAVDGVMARRAMTSLAAPQIDGALLDNIVDYLNYVITPAFFLIEGDLLPVHWRFVAASLVALSSAYQFTQFDAKTKDHFFKGFPSYWNIVVFYLFMWQTMTYINLAIIAFLAAMVFVPIKYVYPSRLSNLSPKRWVRITMLLATLAWGICTASLLWIYPRRNELLMGLSVAYVLLYILVSLMRTFGWSDRFITTEKEDLPAKKTVI